MTQFLQINSKETERETERELERETYRLKEIIDITTGIHWPYLDLNFFLSIK